MSRSSGGRSAVSTIIGTPAWSASTIEGCRFAAADPDVQSTAAGSPVARPVPSAKNPALRSSRITVTSIPGWRQRATASGAEREPGEMTALRTPERASSSAIAEARAVLRLVGSMIKRVAPRLRLRRTLASNGRSVESPRRKRVFFELHAQAGAIVHPQLVSLGGEAVTDRGGEEALGCEAVGDPGVAVPGAERLDGVGGGGDADRALQSAGEVRGDHLRDL